MLGEIAQLHRIPQGHGAGVRGDVSGNEVQQGGFSCPVAADNAHPVVSLQEKVKVPEDPLPIKGLAHAGELHGLPAQA